MVQKRQEVARVHLYRLEHGLRYSAVVLVRLHGKDYVSSSGRISGTVSFSPFYRHGTWVRNFLGLPHWSGRRRSMHDLMGCPTLITATSWTGAVISRSILVIAPLLHSPFNFPTYVQHTRENYARGSANG